MAQLLNQSLTDAAAALRTLFADEQKTLRSNTVIFQSDHPAVLEMLYRALITAENAHNSHDAIAALNEIVGLTPGQPLLEVLEHEFFEMLVRRKLDIADYLKNKTVSYEQIVFYRDMFMEVESGINELRKLQECKHLNPAIRGCLAGKSFLSDTPEKVVEMALMRDPFSISRSFRYLNGNFHACNISSVPVEKFFGFHGVRQKFDEHLSNFAAGKGNVPLLVSSLPGQGKTQFSIAYTLNQPELTLIFAEPETLSGELEELINALSLRKRRKFIVFFDDIEPETIQWYGFRTNVGGSATLPENIMFILASNYHFPINILSRGREITFPVFDEIRCTEMVEDFLSDFGLKNANENLAAVIGAGYIEDFGQKKFTELSPRTLIRYLEKFRKDAALRKKMLDMSHQEMIVKPDAQLFYEFNIKLLRQLYGESFIDELREERLRNI